MRWRRLRKSEGCAKVIAKTIRTFLGLGPIFKV